ncbi:L-glutaminase [Nitrospirillum viridazoti]|uniref:Glutaminase n=1 Tax=Nitrospirillum viridazoti CBAmc TaxID=1441467 RepID=A0A248JV29_9PROT|nr:glutaminase [Nitrospirillum amazonense CBAmc]TWB43128.1 L-glutaminase [Nitrospirillum amazonense]
MAAPVTLQGIIQDIVDEMRAAPDRGKVATYIPSLAKVDPARFGMAVYTVDGECHAGGDDEVGFSIQSISKVFSLTLALGKAGDQLWERVGREPSGTAFNSIVQLEAERGIPRNPFINAGAIVVTDVNLAGHPPREAIGELVQLVRYLAEDESIAINEEVARSEERTGERNRALAHFMKSYGVLRHAPDLVLGTYFHACAIEMTCRQLAAAGRYLMLDGRHPGGGRTISSIRARRILSLMLTCGHYDASGDIAFRVGIPAKSGVGGGILAIVPGRASIAVWSPGLNANGNSQLGSLALERLAEATGWSLFNPGRLSDR